MIGRLALGAALALAAAGPVPAPATRPAVPQAASAERPAALPDRLGWNAFERTRTGLGRLEDGDAAGAAQAFDTALRLRPDDPLAHYNAGTGRLAAGRSDALAPLEAAARGAGPALAPDAWYNLGNARLAAGDARGAIEAYSETLRRASDRLEAKKNLELALRALERERERQSEERPSAGADAQAGESRSGAGGGTESRPRAAGEGDDRAPGESAPNRDSGPDSATGDPSANPPGDRRSPDDTAVAGGDPAPGGQRALHDFRDQPDLDAEQAAALLAAVQNLERQQRRERSLERARSRGRAEKDW